ncbi:UNVERIFIED_CONTAM: hypothetical protein HHA_204150 [Hammondia hammondi]|eukprot:XP_008887387.1 hypothetical protein HHA_204150 [Hammondia hammondi]
MVYSTQLRSVPGREASPPIDTRAAPCRATTRDSAEQTDGEHRMGKRKTTRRNGAKKHEKAEAKAAGRMHQREKAFGGWSRYF